MQKDSFLVLGLTEDATQQQIDVAYSTLRKIYQEQRFQEGDAGAEATKKLAELDEAYEQCLISLKSRVSFDSDGVASYAQIENTIKNNRLEDAQTLLDQIESRDAEWHYLQSIIYYKRNWHSESKTQLEVAIALDDSVPKYKAALDRLNNVMAGGGAGGKNANQQQANNGQQAQQQNNRAGYSRPTSNGNGGNTDACCNTCSSLVCCDCCCECFGGDLIPCC